MIWLRQAICLVSIIAPFVSADYGTVFNDLRKLDAGCVHIKSLCDGYTGSLSQDLSFVSALSVLRNDLNTTVSDLNKAGTPTSSDLQSFVNYFRSSLASQIGAVVKCVNGQKATFVKNGTWTQIERLLQEIKILLNKLLDRCISISPNANLASQFRSIKDKINAEFGGTQPPPWAARRLTRAANADYSTVLNDLKTLDADVKNCFAYCGSYDGSGSATLNQRNCVAKIKRDINVLVTDLNSSPTPTAAQAQAVLDYINNTLIPDIKAFLACLKNRKAQYTTAGIKGEVLQNLKDLKTDFDTVLDKFIAKAPTSSLKSGGASSKSNIDAAFNDAISYFS